MGSSGRIVGRVKFAASVLRPLTQHQGATPSGLAAAPAGSQNTIAQAVAAAEEDPASASHIQVGCCSLSSSHHIKMESCSCLSTDLLLQAVTVAATACPDQQGCSPQGTLSCRSSCSAALGFSWQAGRLLRGLTSASPYSTSPNPTTQPLALAAVPSFRMQPPLPSRAAHLWSSSWRSAAWNWLSLMMHRWSCPHCHCGIPGPHLLLPLSPQPARTAHPSRLAAAAAHAHAQP